jgi:pimeloyl-ACP methyl ester carboxylesterase
VIVSDGDRLIPKALSEPLVGAIPGSELALIEGAGHLSSVERPETFTTLVRGFRAQHGVEGRRSLSRLERLGGEGDPP